MLGNYMGRCGICGLQFQARQFFFFADKKDPILKFSSIWSYTGDRNLNFRYHFFFQKSIRILLISGVFYGSPEIFGQIVFVVAEIIECRFLRGVRKAQNPRERPRNISNDK